jgi:hypothetical protein
MGIRFRAAGIATVVLLAFIVVRPAKADEYNFTFTPNPAECAKGWTSPCTDFGSGTFTVGPSQNDPVYYGSMPITAMTGTLDGTAGMFLLPGIQAMGTNSHELAPSPLNAPVNFLADGQQWSFAHFDTYSSWYLFLVNDATGTVEPINMTITASEPPMLLLLSVGLLGLMGLTLLKDRRS